MSGPDLEPIPFIAASPEEAVAQIRARLGPTPWSFMSVL